ncbi:MAG: response regulator [gamma proteobacterium symbiont of Bathyaustriella thionipta]|nr:response regulator [gamma proteobacterium symbiont of Bathyaustriella thionipta]
MALTFNLLLIDIRLPEMDGLTFVTHLREMPQREHIPVIGLSAHYNASVAESARSAGMDSIVAKPVSAEVIDRVLDNLMHPHSAAGGGFTEKTWP